MKHPKRIRVLKGFSHEGLSAEAMVSLCQAGGYSSQTGHDEGAGRGNGRQRHGKPSALVTEGLQPCTTLTELKDTLHASSYFSRKTQALAFYASFPQVLSPDLHVVPKPCIFHL